jgi:hypothetical protein
MYHGVMSLSLQNRAALLPDVAAAAKQAKRAMSAI